MSNFTDVFSNGLIPPSSDAYSSITINTDQHLVWPYNYNGTSLLLTKILDVNCSAGNKLYLPSVTEVSTGESVIVRNTGVNSLQILDFASHSLFTLLPGIAQYFWVRDNTIDASSSWGQITYGAGTATAAAVDLAGKGLTVDLGKLAVDSPMEYCTALTIVLQSTDRGAILNFNQGAAALHLLDGANYANGFYCFVKNSGTGTVSISSITGQLIDGQVSLGLQPMESLILNYSGGEWFTVGYGRSTLYQFSQLLLDVSAGGIFTLSSAQASNKMLTFIGNPASDVLVRVPAIVAVYYLACNITTAVNVQVATPSDTGITLHQTQRSVVLCDGATVAAAQSASVTTALSMLDGTVAAPALNFASKTNTGIYKYGTQGIGFSVNGIAQWYTNGGGTIFPLLTTLLGNQTFGGTAPRITGDMSNATLASRLMLQSSTVNGATDVGVMPNGTSTTAGITAYNAADTTNASTTTLQTTSTQSKVIAGKTGSGSYKPLALNVGGVDIVTCSVAGDVLIASTGELQFFTTGYGIKASTGLEIKTTDFIRFMKGTTEQARVDTNGNLIVTSATGGLGYGTGAGGAVTQTTSKATAVTLNKPCGQITMNGAALAAGATVAFTFTNSLIGMYDVIDIQPVGAWANYTVKAYPYLSNAAISITNTSAGPLSDVVVLTFNLHKGSIT